MLAVRQQLTLGCLALPSFTSRADLPGENSWHEPLLPWNHLPLTGLSPPTAMASSKQTVQSLASIPVPCPASLQSQS